MAKVLVNRTSAGEANVGVAGANNRRKLTNRFSTVELRLRERIVGKKVMDKRKQYSKLKIVSALTILLVVCLVLGFYVSRVLVPLLQTKKVPTFAQQLDYTPEVSIAEYETCWGIFPSHCGQVLYYSTLLNRDEFQAGIDNLTSTKTLPQTIDGYTLFDINLVTEHNLTINSVGDSSDRTSTPEPLAYKWRISEGGEDWVISFYEVVHDGNVYEIDNQPIVGNIVTIMLQTK